MLHWLESLKSFAGPERDDRTRVRTSAGNVQIVWQVQRLDHKSHVRHPQISAQDTGFQKRNGQAITRTFRRWSRNILGRNMHGDGCRSACDWQSVLAVVEASIKEESARPSNEHLAVSDSADRQ